MRKQRLSMKRTITRIIVLLLASMLVSCGGGDGGDSTSGGGSPAAPSTGDPGSGGSDPGSGGADPGDGGGTGTLPSAGAHVEESDAAVSLSAGWTQSDSRFGWSGGAARQSTVSGATASFTFTG